jgi:hypothetical protein
MKNDKDHLEKLSVNVHKQMQQQMIIKKKLEEREKSSINVEQVGLLKTKETDFR